MIVNEIMLGIHTRANKQAHTTERRNSHGVIALDTVFQTSVTVNHRAVIILVAPVNVAVGLMHLFFVVVSNCKLN